MTRAMVLLKRQFDLERARKAEATRIHNQFLRDPLIRTKNEAAMATHRAASITQ